MVKFRLGGRKTAPSGQTTTYRKTEVIQSYLRIWGTCDPIGLDSSDPKKWGIYVCIEHMYTSLQSVYLVLSRVFPHGKTEGQNSVTLLAESRSLMVIFVI